MIQNYKTHKTLHQSLKSTKILVKRKSTKEGKKTKKNERLETLPDLKWLQSPEKSQKREKTKCGCFETLPKLRLQMLEIDRKVPKVSGRSPLEINGEWPKVSGRLPYLGTEPPR